MSTAPHEYEIIDLRSSATKKDGTPLVTKTGRPMWSVNLKIAERPNTWISGLAFSDPSGWVGTKKALVLYVEEYNGRQQPRFRLPPAPRPGGGIAPEKIDEMIGLLREIRDLLAARRSTS